MVNGFKIKNEIVLYAFIQYIKIHSCSELAIVIKVIIVINTHVNKNSVTGFHGTDHFLWIIRRISTLGIFCVWQSI